MIELFASLAIGCGALGAFSLRDQALAVWLLTTGQFDRFGWLR